MSMPNCVPQSPTWLTRSVSWPQNSRIRQIVSPMMVERRWPTCISFAILGDEKSTSTFFFSPRVGLTPSARIDCTPLSKRSSTRETLMKPAGATEVVPTTLFGGSAAMMALPTASGVAGQPSVPLSRLWIAIGELHWKSPNLALLQRETAAVRSLTPWSPSMALNAGNAAPIAAVNKFCIVSSSEPPSNSTGLALKPSSAALAARIESVANTRPTSASTSGKLPVGKRLAALLALTASTTSASDGAPQTLPVALRPSVPSSVSNRARASE